MLLLHFSKIRMIPSNTMVGLIVSSTWTHCGFSQRISAQIISPIAMRNSSAALGLIALIVANVFSTSSSAGGKKIAETNVKEPEIGP
jgi:hypothetical protein